MDIARLSCYSVVLPFDEEYIKVGKGNKWNLADADGNLISDTWFGRISRNTDGSIVTTTANNEELKFVGIGSLREFREVSRIVPAFVVNLVDSHSVERCDRGRYVAKAMFYGMRVYITADGRIYDSDGHELRILFNTVDTERLNNALVRLNKKLHFDFVSDCTSSDWETTIANKKSIFSFYWVTSEYSVACGYRNVWANSETSKWTDDLIVRVSICMPAEVRERLADEWGTPEQGGPTDNRNGNYTNWTWHFHKWDLDRIINVVNSIE